MKKLGIIALAALLVVAFTMPAAALENVFGGYWRTRFVSQTDFTGSSSNDIDPASITAANPGGDPYNERLNLSRVDTRTRLYWTAILNDNVKLVNKFEMDAVFGEPEYGDIGADGICRTAPSISEKYSDMERIPPIPSPITVNANCSNPTGSSTSATTALGITIRPIMGIANIFAARPYWDI